MDFSKVPYHTLTAAHSGFKAGQDKDHPNRVAIIKALELEILKRRSEAIETICGVAAGAPFLSPHEVPAPRNAVIPPRTTDLEAAMKAYGIRSRYNANGDELTGYNPSRPKYPFTFTGRKGGRWKASPEQILQRFG